jgi:hypothetical protein
MRFLLGLAVAILLLGTGTAYAQQLPCDQQATLTGFTTKATVIAAPGVGTSNIYICGYVASAALASIVTFQQGTGAACVTTSAAVGPTIQLAATTTFSDNSDVFRGFLVANPNGLCVTATSAANITIYYHRQ